MRTGALALIAALLAVGPAGAASQDVRVHEAVDVILRLCLAKSDQEIRISKTDSAIGVSGHDGSVEISRQESSGLVGGISKEITALSGEQASEARSCAQKYLKDLVNVILHDVDGARRQAPPSMPADVSATAEGDPERFWGGHGIWRDVDNYCADFQSFLAASSDPGHFRYSGTSEHVALPVAVQMRPIEGNYFIRTERGGTQHYCGTFFHTSGYNAIFCGRAVAYGRPDVFASVFNQTLKDLRDCLLPAGWRQVSVEQGVCLPEGAGGAQCVHIFEKQDRRVWFFSNLLAHQAYGLGLQTRLGP